MKFEPRNRHVLVEKIEKERRGRNESSLARWI
jgi:hypothetical protein